MSEDEVEKADRLLEIIVSVYGKNDNTACSELPFMVKDGEVILSGRLNHELDKVEHQDLKDWAIQNITQLFE
jgi:hypothetical protein